MVNCRVALKGDRLLRRTSDDSNDSSREYFSEQKLSISVIRVLRPDELQTRLAILLAVISDEEQHVMNQRPRGEHT